MRKKINRTIQGQEICREEDVSILVHRFVWMSLSGFKTPVVETMEPILTGTLAWKANDEKPID